MKDLQKQYELIKEGKGNKSYLMKTARQLFPNLITPVLTYEDTIKILKNKLILTENVGGVVTTGKKQDWHSIFNENIATLKEGNLGHNEEWSLEPEGRFWTVTYRTIDGKKEKVFQSEEEARKWIKSNLESIVINGKTVKTYTQNGDTSYNVTYDDGTKDIIYVNNDAWDKINQLHKNAIGGDDAYRKQFTSISEAKVIEKETTKEVTDAATRGYDYKNVKNYDNVFGEEFLKGFYTEMGDDKNKDKGVDELRAIVAKNLAKDINYYVKDGQFGLKGVGYTTEAPGLGIPKEIKGKHKSSGYGDLKEGKIPAENRNTYYYTSLAKKMKENGKSKEEIRQFFKNEEVDSELVDSILTNLFIKIKEGYSDLQESVLRAQIHQLIKEVLAEQTAKK